MMVFGMRGRKVNLSGTAVIVNQRLKYTTVVCLRRFCFIKTGSCQTNPDFRMTGAKRKGKKKKAKGGRRQEGEKIMKKFSSSSQMFSENIKKYLMRAGIVVVSTSLGVASFVTLASDESRVHSKAKLVAVSQLESTAIEDTKVEYSKIEYTDLQKSINDADMLAKVEKTSKETEAVALAAKEDKVDLLTVEDRTEATAEEPTEETTEVTTEATTAEATTTETTTEEPASSSEEMALAKKSKKAKKTTESVGDEKQQRGIEATEATEEATAGAIYVEDDSYQPGTYLGTFTTTAYCGCSYCCGKSDGITASGTYATEGRTIAAPSNFAFGTELIIDGHTYVVEDRGGAIRGNRIDIFFSSHQAALNYGRRTVDVYVK